MKLYQETSVETFLYILQQLTKDNVTKLSQNNIKINSLISNSNTSDETAYMKKELSKKNSELTKQNQQFIQLHNLLVKFYHDFGKHLIIEEEQVTEESDVNIANQNVVSTVNQKNRIEKRSKNKREDQNIEHLEAKLQKHIEMEAYEECDAILRKIERLKAKEHTTL